MSKMLRVALALAVLASALCAGDRKTLMLLEPVIAGDASGIERETVANALHSVVKRQSKYTVALNTDTSIREAVRDLEFAKTNSGLYSKVKESLRLVNADYYCQSKITKEQGVILVKYLIYDGGSLEIINSVSRTVDQRSLGELEDICQRLAKELFDLSTWPEDAKKAVGRTLGGSEFGGWHLGAGGSFVSPSGERAEVAAPGYGVGVFAVYEGKETGWAARFRLDWISWGQKSGTLEGLYHYDYYPLHQYSFDSSLSVTSLSFDVLFYAKSGFYIFAGLSPWATRSQGGSIKYTSDGQEYPGEWENIYYAAGVTRSSGTGYTLGLGWRFNKSFALEFRLAGAFSTDAYYLTNHYGGGAFNTEQPNASNTWSQFVLSYRY
jgi:hypothetical protein